MRQTRERFRESEPQKITDRTQMAKRLNTLATLDLRTISDTCDAKIEPNSRALLELDHEPESELIDEQEHIEHGKPEQDMGRTDARSQKGSSSSGHQDDHPDPGHSELGRQGSARAPSPSQSRMTGFASSKPRRNQPERGQAVDR